MGASHPAFVPWPHRSPLLDAIGSFDTHEVEEGRFGFVVDGAKVNGRGFLHAGAIASIADAAIGHALAAQMGTNGLATNLVTVDLSCNYLGAARLDDWVDGEVIPLKLGRRLAAGLARLTVREQPVAAVSALFVPGSSSGSDDVTATPTAGV